MKNGDDVAIHYYLRAKDVMTTGGLSRALNHLTRKAWFSPGLESFLDSVAFVRAIRGGEGLSPAVEGVSARYVD